MLALRAPFVSGRRTEAHREKWQSLHEMCRVPDTGSRRVQVGLLVLVLAADAWLSKVRRVLQGPEISCGLGPLQALRKRNGLRLRGFSVVADDGVVSEQGGCVVVAVVGGDEAFIQSVTAGRPDLS